MNNNNIQSLDIIKGCGAKLISEKEKEYAGVGTDTRSDLKGQVFFALKGPNFDAHDYLQQAVDQGAVGLVVHDEQKAKAFKDKVSVYLVPDTLIALQDLGSFWRKKNKAKILAVTGSNGKTTTKEFAAAVISANKKTHFNKGSFNNHWGVPLSLLQIKSEHEVAIIEMGMNHLGEIKQLCEIAYPDVVLATNVGRVHLEGLGSIENVAKAKEEIYQDGRTALTRIFNLDNPFTRKMFEKYRKIGGRNITFSTIQEKSDVYLQIASESPEKLELVGKIAGVAGKASVSVFGPHNVYNIMGAAAFALSVDISPKQIWQSLPECKTPWGRNQKVKLKCGAELIFDGYNANPESMGQMIENSKLVQTKGKKIAIIGEMLETGTARDEVHFEIGKAAGLAGFDFIWFVGAPQKAFGDGLQASNFKNTFVKSLKFDSAVAEDVKSSLQTEDRIWVKGSRGIKLEQAVFALEPVDFVGLK